MRTGVPKSGCAKTAPSREQPKRQEKACPHSLPGGGLPRQNPGGTQEGPAEAEQIALWGNNFFDNSGPVPKIRPLLF